MAKDIIHEPVKSAIKNDGWTITHDHFTLQFAEFTMYADLAAERIIAAEQGKRKIAIEVKSFVKLSAVQDVRDSLGQYVVYRAYLAQIEPERKLYMAISTRAYHDIFSLQAVQFLVKEFHVALVIVNVELKEVVAWIE